MKIIRLFLFAILLLSQIIGFSQNTEFLSYPEFAISISPEIPYVCPGEAAQVICNEEFEDYEWEGVGFEFQAFGKEVTLTQTGQYTLTIKGEVDGTYYFKILNFYTESSDWDNDGFCNSVDCAPSNALVAEGIVCDDGNPCTENDEFNNECTCVGTAITDCDFQDTNQQAANKSELKKQLQAAFTNAIKRDYKSSTNLDVFVGRISDLPFAINLLKDDIRTEILALPSSDIKSLFLDMMESRFSPHYLGNDLETISANKIRAWHGISQAPIQFRAKSSIQDSVSSYMLDFKKSPNDIALEISNAKKGYLWWYTYVLGRKYWKPFLDDMDSINAFAAEILAYNKETEGGGRILSGRPSSAINTALYYDDVLEQGASIFKTIIKNHMFYDGNKRTAMNTIKSFMKKAGIPINKTDKKIFKLAKKVATDQVIEVSDIANKLIK